MSLQSSNAKHSEDGEELETIGARKWRPERRQMWGYGWEKAMQRWEYLQLACDVGGTAIDCSGRVWHGKRVKAQTGLERSWLGDKGIWAEVTFTAAFADLGAEGWELVGVVPGSAGYSAVQAEVIGTGWPRSRSLMIFKRPSPG